MRVRPMSHVGRPQIREGSIEAGAYRPNGQDELTQNNPTIPKQSLYNNHLDFYVTSKNLDFYDNYLVSIFIFSNPQSVSIAFV